MLTFARLPVIAVVGEVDPIVTIAVELVAISLVARSLESIAA